MKENIRLVELVMFEISRIVHIKTNCILILPFMKTIQKKSPVTELILDETLLQNPAIHAW